MIDAAGKKIKEGAQIYWVCPLVEESEKLDLEAAEARYDILKEQYGDVVGLVHGRMKPAEKDEVMQRFANNELKILVATTVIEVGVDLELRGGGEILGTRQSGDVNFRLADMPAHGDLLVAARDDTKLILHNDENLESERGQALKTLLYLFEQDQAIARLRAG